MAFENCIYGLFPGTEKTSGTNIADYFLKKFKKSSNY